MHQKNKYQIELNTEKYLKKGIFVQMGFFLILIKCLKPSVINLSNTNCLKPSVTNKMSHLKFLKNIMKSHKIRKLFQFDKMIKQ